MARWPINAWMHVMAAIVISLDCTSIGIIVKSIPISLDCVLMSISSNRLRSAQTVYQWMLTVVLTVGLMVGLTMGLAVSSTWLCWAIDLSKAFNSSDERLLWLSAERA